MNREERIVWARRKAAEGAPERARKQQQETADRSQRIVSMGSTEANRMAYLLSQDDSIPWLGPISHPYEWTQAVEAARAVTIEAARRSRTITYGELRIAAYKATDMKVGHNQFAELAMNVNRPGDECLLSAIIVGADTGRPGKGFLPFAREEGFDQPLPTLQRLVFAHFRLDRD